MGGAGSAALASLLGYTRPWSALVQGDGAVSYFQLLAGRKKKGEGTYLSESTPGSETWDLLLISPEQRIQLSTAPKEELLGASTALLCLSVTHPIIPNWDNAMSKTAWGPWSEEAQPHSTSPSQLFPRQVCCRSLPSGAPTGIIGSSHSKTCAATAADFIVWPYWHSNPITVHLRVFLYGN